MTREEELYKAANKFSDDYKYSGDVDYMRIRITFRKGAEWADKTMIEKACKWLLRGGYFVNNTETIDDFKRAMEE